ncbi:MAG: Holliday junction resolvase RuvX [Candidatus Dormibacteraeota bacterium]|nr:Holliday junction resolvase RuvX [Candidatus Dormibacteraeota bacterium]
MAPAGRVLAIDPGSKRVGVALSDPGGVLATPLLTLPAEPAATLVDRLLAVAASHQAVELVVGLPRRLDGSSGPEAQAASRLASELRAQSGLLVKLVDERLTSVIAERALLANGRRRDRRKELSDRVAAAVILQGHLDSRRKQE